MADAIGRLSPGAQAETCRYHLTGQESNAGVATTLGKLGQCDLIVDATGHPKVFNLLAAVVRRASRPMVWMEVFGGGIGGLIARSRPGTDPTPQDMRLAYLQFCTENPDKSPTRSVGNYAREDADGEVLVASDADVAIIAHHAVRIVVDCFLPPAESKFPHSMYLIGLAQAWVFEAPFATIPISTSVIAGSSEGDSKETNDSEGENLVFLLSLIQKR